MPLPNSLQWRLLVEVAALHVGVPTGALRGHQGPSAAQINSSPRWGQEPTCSELPRGPGTQSTPRMKRPQPRARTAAQGHWSGMGRPLHVLHSNPHIGCWVGDGHHLQMCLSVREVRSQGRRTCLVTPQGPLLPSQALPGLTQDAIEAQLLIALAAIGDVPGLRHLHSQVLGPVDGLGAPPPQDPATTGHVCHVGRLHCLQPLHGPGLLVAAQLVAQQGETSLWGPGDSGSQTQAVSKDDPPSPKAETRTLWAWTPLAWVSPRSHEHGPASPEMALLKPGGARRPSPTLLPMAWVSDNGDPKDRTRVGIKSTPALSCRLGVSGPILSPTSLHWPATWEGTCITLQAHCGPEANSDSTGGRSGSRQILRTQERNRNVG